MQTINRMTFGSNLREKKTRWSRLRSENFVTLSKKGTSMNTASHLVLSRSSGTPTMSAESLSSLRGNSWMQESTSSLYLCFRQFLTSRNLWRKTLMRLTSSRSKCKETSFSRKWSKNWTRSMNSSRLRITVLVSWTRSWARFATMSLSLRNLILKRNSASKEH